MEVHEAAGNPAEALRAFEELRILLRDELGTTPGPAAMAVHERLLRGEAPAARVAEPAPTTIPAVAWPAPLAAALGRHALVGRARELGVLEEYWDEALAGARQLVLLSGDAGIGKTRLAAELGRRARDDGALVLYGRFDEEAIAPYQPVVEMVRGWSSGASLEPLRERLGVRAAELGILFGELGPPPADRRRDPTATACASSTRWRRCSARPARRRRSCSCSTTCTGPTGRRSSSSGTSSARRSRAARCCSAPTARPSSSPATRCTS